MSALTPYLKVIQLIFRQGSLRVRRVDFDGARGAVLAGLGAVNQKKSAYASLRRGLMKWPVFYFLFHNASAVKNRRRVLREYFISPADQLVFVRIFKNASTSILRGMLPRIDNGLRHQNLNDDQVDALAHSLSAHRLGAELNKYVRFAIVRDPFRRLVSAYRDVFDPNTAVFAYEGYLFGVFKKDMDFPTFVRTLCQIPDPLRGPHFASQTLILSYVENVKVYKLESEATALAQFLGR
ncbi:MAG: sulfotransferase family protein, partial [Bacteroidia bacterium]|nr:sulfotransferase family protein [Bacteroidia bacterium]